MNTFEALTGSDDLKDTGDLDLRQRFHMKHSDLSESCLHSVDGFSFEEATSIDEVLIRYREVSNSSRSRCKCFAHKSHV